MTRQSLTGLRPRAPLRHAGIAFGVDACRLLHQVHAHGTRNRTRPIKTNPPIASRKITE
jgi:hypothetical protein